MWSISDHLRCRKTPYPALICNRLIFYIYSNCIIFFKTYSDFVSWDNQIFQKEFKISFKLASAQLFYPYALSLVLLFLFGLFLFLPYVLCNQTVLMLQWLWHLMVQAVRPCLGLRAASGRHMSFLLLYWLVFLSGQNIIFISLHSEWQFLKIAPHQGIFITFCGPAWVARQLFISPHLSSISLSQKAHFFLAIFLLYFAMTFLLKLLGLLFTVWDLRRIILHHRISHTLRCPITCDRNFFDLVVCIFSA